MSEENIKVAVTSQNRRIITGHAGKCRNFRVFEIEGKIILGSELIELNEEETFHSGDHRVPPPIAGIKALISGGMGQGLFNRLDKEGIEAIITDESDPETAVQKYLAGTLVRRVPQVHSGEAHHDHH